MLYCILHYICLSAFHEHNTLIKEVVLCFYAEVLPLHQLEYNSVVSNLTPKSKFSCKQLDINRALTRLYAQVAMWAVCFNNGGGTILILAMIIITNVAGKVW